MKDEKDKKDEEHKWLHYGRGVGGEKERASPSMVKQLASMVLPVSLLLYGQ